MRFKDHRVHLKRGTHHCYHLQRSWNKYGSESFIFEIVEDVDPLKLAEREQFYMDCYPQDQLYNICPTAYNQAGVKRSEEVKAKLKVLAKNRKRPIPFTDEHRANISKAGSGRKHTDEAKKKMSEAKKGRKSSTKHIENFRKARTGVPTRKRTDEQKRKQSERQTGVKPSEKAKKKMREAKLGKKASDETRAKQSDAQKLRWVIRKLKINPVQS